MIKKMKNQAGIRTQFGIVILCAALLAFLLFEILWLNKWEISHFLTGRDAYHTLLDDVSFMETFCETAKGLDIPASEEDTEGIDALSPLFALADEYTSIYIYDAQDGLYRAGQYASIMDSGRFRFFFDKGYRITDGEGETIRMFPVSFRNGTAFVTMTNYSRSLLIYPYLTGCLTLSFLLFFTVVLFFISRKIKSVLVLKDEILTMASGDLTHSVPDLGGDEIGILARELNHLRNSLHETIVNEQESHQANQDLITALSHDLRTPLTVLTGYLEVLRLKMDSGKSEENREYLGKCLKKAEEIKELTDRMFEYALVSEEKETPDIDRISMDFIRQCLVDNCNYIKLAGFTPKLLLPDTTGVLESDPIMLKRIFNNLFSNILKYGDKSQPVGIAWSIREHTLSLSVSNTPKQEISGTDSSNIGLKNVRNMLCLLDGEMSVEQETNHFTVTLRFPLQQC